MGLRRRVMRGLTRCGKGVAFLWLWEEVIRMAKGTTKKGGKGGKGGKGC